MKITAGNMDKKAGPLLALTCLPVTYSGEEHNSTSAPILGRQTKGARRLLRRAVEDGVAQYIERWKHLRDDEGHRMVVRMGDRIFVCPNR